MKVRELIAELAKHDPEAEVHYPTNDGWDSTEINEAYASTTQYGIMLPQGPTTVPIVVLASGSEGL